MIKKCLICNKNFKTYPCHVKKGWGKFCSVKCYVKRIRDTPSEKLNGWRGGKAEIVCEVCGAKFLRPKYRVKQKARFCSTSCMGKWQTVSGNKRGVNNGRWKGGPQKINCDECGKEFLIKNDEIEKSKNHFCSKNCHKNWQGKNTKGKDCPSWKGGKLIRECVICGKEFKIFPNVAKHGNGKLCSGKCRGIYVISNMKKSGTGIEIKMEHELAKRNIILKKQYPIWQARTVPDFFITPNIFIYCDGDYWHNLPNIKALNENQNYWLNFLGYKVYRFWEHEINKDVSKCVDIIKEIR